MRYLQLTLMKICSYRHNILEQWRGDDFKMGEEKGGQSQSIKNKYLICVSLFPTVNYFK